MILVTLVDEAGAHHHVGLAGRHSLVQDHSLLLECLNKVRISVLQTTGLGVQLVTPVVRVRVDPGLGTQQFSLQMPLLPLQSIVCTAVEVPCQALST